MAPDLSQTQPSQQQATDSTGAASGANVESSATGAPGASSTGAQRRVVLANYPPPMPQAIPTDEPETDSEDEPDHPSRRAIIISEAPSTSQATGAAAAPRPEEHDGNDSEDEESEDILALYNSDEEEIDLTHLKLRASGLKSLRLERFARTLKHLSLRANLLRKLPSSSHFELMTELRNLDLYDNELEKVPDVIKKLEKLETLDLSFNNIRHVSNISHLYRCRTLYFVQNKIGRIREDDFKGPIADSLTSLELGGNRIRTIEHIDHLSKLEELWVGKNKITKLENIASLSSLRILSIQSNRITKLENLGDLTGLEELYIAHNGLTQIGDGLKDNSNLKVLDVSGNQIEEIDGVSHLSKLVEFWANDNKIATLNTLDKHFGPSLMPHLETVYLEGNPAQREEGPNYRRKVMLACPQIKQIDATFVKA
ncbi:protein phosphatase regulatory subunit Sds22 [Tilletia horrida]|uniref:Protein phosphatase regulatory subunit Sds22 n=1 Tax=Tilletia horrida TaxID=155126 RepID=A0AAN6GTH0_9BASI|nr:protein phosphatase regulatory subunit Sds22 [Tilletia horrida]KAK0552800.1 protein phosphatase regulatory subunit Sds22 [Tilletia horrida]KAK0567278.1 protein phosphatase regulatory subunit Sds22 [Tilletia horrida]